MISEDSVRKTVVELFIKAETRLPRDVERGLASLEERETGVGSTQLRNIAENFERSRERGVPMCQDTGLPIVYVNVGGKAKVDLDFIYRAIYDGIIEATGRVPLRRHMVEPLSRRNVTDSLRDYSPFISLGVAPGADYVELTVLPKGGGSENMSALAMLKPSEGARAVKRFVIETVARAGGNPCPPIVVGVGIGGSSDAVMKLAKTALLRRLDDKNGDSTLAALENELLKKINELGIGPMGLGGKATALAVKIECAPCHTASLPVGVNIQCWANRRASARIFEDGVEFKDE